MSFLPSSGWIAVRKITLLICFATGLIACSDPQMQEATISGSIMGTTYSVKLVTEQPIQQASLEDIEKGIQNRLDEIDTLMSTYKADSEVTRFNALAPGKEFVVSEKTFELISRSVELNQLTNGFFDISVSPLVDLWGFGSTENGVFNQVVPEQHDLDQVIAKIGMTKLVLNEAKQSVSKTSAIEIDLSAIAKGYAVDQVAGFLDGFFLKNYLVEVGGELRVKGLNKSFKPWSLGIETPDVLARKAHSIVTATSGALATSGDYRNYFEQDGVRYSHLIDPTTYAPVTHKLASVSVLSGNCADADALATALMVMGETKGLEFARQNKLDAMFIYRQNDSYEVAYSGRFSEYLVN